MKTAVATASATFTLRVTLSCLLLKDQGNSLLRARFALWQMAHGLWQIAYGQWRMAYSRRGLAIE